ncbi:MAG: ATP-dependent DNA helicase RecG [Acidithiobacillales bacterium SM1_46]|jgi:ATP-dependent DNA helicase RecG|nr:MAG: ATP-dependent DNA helicase RecG [Acidithiobacillales bacterium SM1_46]
MDLATLSLSVLKGAGPKLRDKLSRLGLRTVQDVLFHLPLRYQDRTHITPIGAIAPGQEALVVGQIELADVAFRRRRTLIVRVADGTGSLILRFFHFNSAQQENFARGRKAKLFGEVRAGPGGLEMVHPEYELSDDHMVVAPDAHLTPVYPTTEGVHQLGLRKLTDQALDRYLGAIHEWLPAELLAPLKLPTLQEALAFVHRPPPGAPVDALLAARHPAQQRLAFEEMLAFHLSLKRLRARMRRHSAPVLVGAGSLYTRFLASLPFTPTGAQQRVLAEIGRDLRMPHPMQRLVQGDVGSGKTLVAAGACLAAIDAGWQAAVMAPTELLAEQHWRNFAHWLAPLGLQVAFLTGSLPAKTRRAMVADVSEGRASLVIGTHALFQEDVQFHRLGLIVVDEQHRFGVHQRLQLREKGAADGLVPHQLIMTATPIPRTLAQSFYADLDVSVIDELPPGRKPVDTVVIPDARRPEVVTRVRDACLTGRQAYWVCPLIEESENLELQTATQTAEALAGALPELRIALVHGRMKAAEKERIMAAFKAGSVHLLVATTVIEVGVDVPNASLMIIENAERLGLSQLHQLRGRVGRGGAQSTCVLLYQSPLSTAARERLAAVRETNDGFEIARRDLDMRGPGEVLGTRQTGDQQFHIADLVRDQALLPKIEEAAALLLEKYPAHVEPIIARWLGRRESYGEV